MIGKRSSKNRWAAALLILIILLPGGSLRAQQSPTPIPLIFDDLQPSADVYITLTNDAPGVVQVELNGVALTVSDSTNTPLLTMTDSRIGMVALQITQNSPSLALHLERLPGMPTGSARITPQAVMASLPVTVNSSPLSGLTTSFSGTLSAAPASTLPIRVTGGVNLISAQFSGQNAQAQITDSNGLILLTVQGGSTISAFMAQLPVGTYSLAVATSDLQAHSDVSLALAIAPIPFSLALAPTTAAVTQVGAPTNAVQLIATRVPTATSTISVALCTATVNIVQVNLRSGAGTSFSVVGVAPQGTAFVVNGIDQTGNWLFVQSSVGNAWVTSKYVTLNGACQSLKIVG